MNRLKTCQDQTQLSCTLVVGWFPNCRRCLHMFVLLSTGVSAGLGTWVVLMKSLSMFIQAAASKAAWIHVVTCVSFGPPKSTVLSACPGTNKHHVQLFMKRLQTSILGNGLRKKCTWTGNQRALCKQSVGSAMWLARWLFPSARLSDLPSRRTGNAQTASKLKN